MRDIDSQTDKNNNYRDGEKITVNSQEATMRRLIAAALAAVRRNGASSQFEKAPELENRVTASPFAKLIWQSEHKVLKSPAISMTN